MGLLCRNRRGNAYSEWCKDARWARAFLSFGDSTNFLALAQRAIGIGVRHPVVPMVRDAVSWATLCCCVQLCKSLAVGDTIGKSFHTGAILENFGGDERFGFSASFDPLLPGCHLARRCRVADLQPV